MKRQLEQDTITICIKNLPRNLKEEEIKKYFSDCNVSEMRLPKFKDTEELKGIGFIDVSNDDEYNKILNYNGSIFNNFQLQVEESKAKRRKEDKKEYKKEEYQEQEYKSEPQQQQQQQHEEEEFKIFIGNLSPNCSDQQLKESFSECGEVINVVRPVYKDTGRLKNFAFIFFTNEESMKEALKFNDTLFFNKTIKVNTTLKKEEREKREEERIEFLMRDQSNTLFIKNISFDSTEEYVRNSFEMCGKIREIRIPLHSDTKRQKGFVFVEFEDSKGAEKALKWNGTYLDEQT
eukprot:gene11495-4659_t